MNVIRNIVFILSLIITLWFGFIIFVRLIRKLEIPGLPIFIEAIGIVGVITYFMGLY